MCSRQMSFEEEGPFLWNQKYSCQCVERLMFSMKISVLSGEIYILLSWECALRVPWRTTLPVGIGVGDICWEFEDLHFCAPSLPYKLAGVLKGDYESVGEYS